MGLFLNSVGQYRSTVYEVARGLLRSRDNQKARAERLAQQLDRQLQVHANLQRKQLELQQELQLARQQRDQAWQENQQLRAQAVRLPDDPPLPNHSYGPRMISLCIQLAKKVGLRASVDALKILFNWLAIETKIPCWTSVRMWLCRMGVDGINQAVKPHDDWIWMADHSNQIGKEKVLTILGIRASRLPPPGQTLCHQDVHVLAVVPGTQWKRDDVATQYRLLADKIGVPRMLLTDGAVELRESAEVLEKLGTRPILLRDMKHFAANAFERMIGHSARFQEYLTLLGRSRSSIQQTELSHFTPPPQKPKARFMNLAPTLRWGEMIAWQLEHTDSQARQGISSDRMDDKLGWLKDFRSDIAQWRRIERVISESLSFINSQGLYRGVSRDLGLRLDDLRTQNWERCERSDQMAQTLIKFVADSEQQLGEDERGWLSTEILESSFGLYKALEGQHSKGGFTSLLASFSALLSDCTAAQIRHSFNRTSVQDVKSWVSKSLGRTLASKKSEAYKESAFAPTVS